MKIFAAASAEKVVEITEIVKEVTGDISIMWLVVTLTVILLAILIAGIIIYRRKLLRKKIYEVWMEFWHVEIVNGKKSKFKFSSKKFHFQIAQFMWYTSVILKTFSPDWIAARLEVGVLALLASHTVATGTWYAWRKHQDIKVQAEIDASNSE